MSVNFEILLEFLGRFKVNENTNFCSPSFLSEMVRQLTPFMLKEFAEEDKTLSLYIGKDYFGFFFTQVIGIMDVLVTSPNFERPMKIIWKTEPEYMGGRPYHDSFNKDNILFMIEFVENEESTMAFI